MELIERYLQAVKFALPQAQREDIIKELRDSILSQIEEKQAELGRPLSEDEQAELLKKMGSPMHLAGRYGKQRYLIGATMFPMYWKTLKASLGLALLVLTGASIASAAAGKTLSESLAVLARYPGIALTVFAWITLAFSALELFGGKCRVSEQWDPRKLPPLMKQDPRKSRFELVTQLVMQTIFGIWWLAGLHYQYLVFGPGAAFLRFGPVWRSIYPLFVLLVVVDVMFTAAWLVWPRWTQGRPIGRLVMNALGLVVLYFLLNGSDLLVAADAAAPQLQALTRNLNYGIRLGLMAAVIVNILNMVKHTVRLVGEKLGHAHHATV
jgi:hypothetical protein